MADMKEACKKVLEECEKQGVRFPMTWSGEEAKVNKMKAAFELLSVQPKLEDGGFAIDAAVEKLAEKFGVLKKKEEEDGGDKKRKAEEDPKEEDEGEDEGEDEDGGKKKAKKPKKKAPEEMKKNQYVVEENRAFGEVLLEMAELYYKEKEPRKGGVFSKGAKAFREAESAITNKKEAMALKGVGKGIAAYLEEFNENGYIEKLEKLRAGEI